MASHPRQASVLLTAFRGEAAALEQTLQQLHGALPGVQVQVLGSDDETLAAVASRAGVQCLPCLPDACAPDAYWCQLSAALRSHQQPVIVLRAGTALPQHWYGRLGPQTSVPHLAAWFPLSIRHPCTTIFQDCSQASDLSVDALDTWLNQYAPGCTFDLPLLSGWTAWLDPHQFPEQEFRNDADLAKALIESGRKLLGSDALLVDDRCYAPQPLPQLYPAWHESLQHHHPLAQARHALSELALRNEAPAAELAPVRPVRLHLSHGWGGGLWRWVEDFSAANQSCLNLILRPVGEPNGFGKAMVLYAADAHTPLASWTLTRPILSTALTHHEYATLLDSVIADFGVSEVLVSSLIGHSLEALQTGLPTTVICHDFYPLCPLVVATWQGPCGTCNAARLRDCLRHNPARRFFDYEADAYWQTVREKFLSVARQRHLRFVAPTPSVAARWQSLADCLPLSRFSVIPHGLPPLLLEGLVAARSAPAALADSSKPLVVVLGSLDLHKGGALLREALPTLLPYARFLLLGVGESGKHFEGQEGVQVIRSYPREQLGPLLAEHQPALGLLLSTVPETFSYTLSELHAAGIPVAATALGAFADRIKHEDNGWLFPPQHEATSSLLQALLKAPQRIVAVAQRLRLRHARSTAAMVADYNAHSGAALLLAPLRRPPRRVPQAAPQAVVETQNPDRDQGAAVSVHADASFGEALQGFAGYTQDKLRNTERIPSFLKRVLLALLRPFRRG